MAKRIVKLTVKDGSEIQTVYYIESNRRFGFPCKWHKTNDNFCHYLLASALDECRGDIVEIIKREIDLQKK